MMRRIFFFGGGESDGDPDRRDILGGKGASLSALTRAGLPVPPGFTISVQCCESYLGAGGAWPEGLKDEIRGEIKLLEATCGRKFGQGDQPLLVSVRSGAAVSMPGMMDTILNCGMADDKEPFDELIECVEAVFDSWNSPRAIAYRRERNIRGLSGTAVTVQAMFPSRVSGVAFTANPTDPEAGEIVIESSYGLGEAIVSGEVDPDNFVLSRDDLSVKKTYIGRKDRIIPAAGDSSLAPGDQPSLTDEQIRSIAQMAMDVEELFGFPVDVEWGLADGRFSLLQARRIRQSAAQSRELLLQSIRTALGAELGESRGPWVLHNLSETLAHPTWLTWSVQERFMSGAGGFGAMYKLAGFEPSQAVSTRGPVRLIAGKIYMDVSLASELFFEDYPFKYDMNLLRWDPDAAQSPPTIPAGTFRSRSAAAKKVARVDLRLRQIACTLDGDLNDRVIPEFVAWCRAEKQRDLASMSNDELAVLWRAREHRVMDGFAPQSLLPSLIIGMVMAELEAFIAENLWDVQEDADELAAMLSAAPQPDKTLQANAAMFGIAGGDGSVDQWLQQYGHRGPDELDLASPRWREIPDEVAQMARRLEGGQDPLDLHHAHVEQVAKRTDELRGRLSGARRQRFDQLLELLRRYIPFREDGKYYLMLGYDLLRDVALEAARRLEIGDDVFYLTASELCDAIRSGAFNEGQIARRTEDYRTEARIVLPRVIDKSAIESLGRPPARDASESYDAYELSAGVASGPVRIVESLHQAGDLGRDYVLVCRSTDPAWTPLFVNAAALVLECGGALSHGAIVAREMGIPAVVLPDATNLLTEGDIVAVDGHNGSVGAIGSVDGSENHAADPDDVRISSSLAPPPRSGRERFAARLRNISLCFWGVYLLAAFCWPEQLLYRPSIELIDAILWPIVAKWGMIAVVVMSASGLAALTMIIQRLLVDNRQLRQAKLRAAALMKEAASLPEGSPRKAALKRVAAPVNVRLLAAAMLPIGLLLGPMIMMFMWFPMRVDPASWNAAPGTTVRIVASIDSGYGGSVTLSPQAPAYLADGSPAQCTTPRIEEALEQLADAPDELWKELVDSDRPIEELRAELKERIAYGLEPVKVMWEIKTPPKAEGVFPVTISAPRARQPLELNFVLGDGNPPGAIEFISVDLASAPILSARVIYPPPKTKRFFWTPLTWLGDNQWDAGWLLTYLLAYLPVMFCLRWILRIA